jgi:hypothetical protein
MGVVAEHRRLNLSARMSNSAGVARVVEPEMDMRRCGPQQSAVTSRMVDLVRWLTPAGARPTGSPMRSVAREIEELWPSRDR